MKVRKAFLTAWAMSVFPYRCAERPLGIISHLDFLGILHWALSHVDTSSYTFLVFYCPFLPCVLCSKCCCFLNILNQCSRLAFHIKEALPKSTPTGGIWKTYQLNGWHLSWMLTVPIGSMNSSHSPTQSWNCVCDLSRKFIVLSLNTSPWTGSTCLDLVS